MADEPRDPDALLARAGVHGDPDRDQHFLIDDRVLDRILTYARDMADPMGTVLEVGPGTGALTDRLLRQTDRVVAVEHDRTLIQFLQREFSTAIEADRLALIQGDAVAVDIPPFDLVVSNLPYGAASEIIFRLLPRRRPMVVMTQYEFAQRLCADAGTSEYGRLTVTAWYYADATLLETVPPTAFQPPPPVESAIVALRPREPPTAVDATVFNDFVTAVFTQRRKTLRNAIRNTTHISDLSGVDAFLETLDPALLDRRPATIEPSTYVRLVERAYADPDTDQIEGAKDE